MWEHKWIAPSPWITLCAQLLWNDPRSRFVPTWPVKISRRQKTWNILKKQEYRFSSLTLQNCNNNKWKSPENVAKWERERTKILLIGSGIVLFYYCDCNLSIYNCECVCMYVCFQWIPETSEGSGRNSVGPFIPGQVLGYPDAQNSEPPGYPLYWGGKGFLVRRASLPFLYP